MEDSIKDIIKQFNIHGDFIDARAHGNGHINDTFAVTFSQAGTHLRYLLRRINDDVFAEPDKMMQNIVKVTGHIRNKLINENADDISRKVMTAVQTRDGHSFYKTGSGNYWTVFLFIENAHTCEFLADVNQAYEAAKMFGQFQQMLSDIPADSLHDTIVNFHDGPKRFADFQQAFSTDKYNRAACAKTEIEYLQQQAYIFDILPKLAQTGEIPLRITHNDTKINNIMFDSQTRRALCVVDLDTVMPGLSAYDFGDLVRTTVSPTEEDEPDISKIHINMPAFEALARGYLESAGSFLNDTEKQHLVLGGKMMTLIMATRFLTDYLQGDIYYKTHRPGHNLDRCRTQLQLLKCINRQEPEMTEIFEKFSKG